MFAPNFPFEVEGLHGEDLVEVMLLAYFHQKWVLNMEKLLNNGSNLARIRWMPDKAILIL
jgi:hypothetical protein